MSRKVFVVGKDYSISKLFAKFGWTIAEHAEDLDEIDLICFTGGADVDPKWYRQKKHPRTFLDVERDKREIAWFDKASNADVPMVGICRGGQFLNIMSGGSMYQNVTEHTGSHNMLDLTTGKVLWVSSTHHQMMKPGLGHTLLAVASKEKCIVEWMEEDVICSKPLIEQPEVVFYQGTKSLCFQPHPEYHNNIGDSWEPMAKLFFQYINTFLFKDKK